MKNIRLINCADEITNETLQKLYLSRLSHIQNVLPYYDAIGIRATVTLHGQVRNGRLVTRLDVDCANEHFANTLKQAIKNSEHVPTPTMEEALWSLLS